MARTPAVSVIIPTHKRLPFLQQAVRSVLSQTFSDLELLVVADGHQDEVEQYVQSLADERVRYVSSPFAGLPAAARNTGIRLARGDFVALCDDDDFWCPTKLAVQLGTMRPTGPAFTFTACRSVDQNGTPIKNDILGAYNYVTRTDFLLSLGGMIYNSSIVVSRDLLRRAGFFDESPSLRSAEDYELCTRLLMHSDAVGIPEVLVSYRAHSGSIQPRRALNWLALQREIQRAILRNGSTPLWLWSLRYGRVLYWTVRLAARSS